MVDAPDRESCWNPAPFFRVGPDGQPQKAWGYEYRGLMLRNNGWANPRWQTRWGLWHLGSGGEFVRFMGDVQTVFPVAAEIAECGDWTLFSLPGGWRQTDPDLETKFDAICRAHREAHCMTEWEGQDLTDNAARAVIEARENET